jgi:hypothetical protein
MMTTPANAIREEVRKLIQTQIETFGRASRLTSSELSEHHDRAEKIRQLGQELDRIGTMSVLGEKFRQAS